MSKRMRMRICGELKSMTEYIAEFTVEKKPLDFPNLMIHTHGELVRCRDCKHHEAVPEDNGDWCGYWTDRIYGDDGYCKWGERKEDD